MDAHTLKLFQRKAIKSKKEILETLSDYLFHLMYDKKHSSDDVFYRPALIELVNRFIKKVDGCDLIYIEKPFVSYEIVITNTEISLNLVEYTKIILNDSNKFESTESSVRASIICAKAHFISAAEFAQRFSIDVDTAVSWIKDRRIKCAEKRSSGWYIVETQGIPSKEPQSGSYIFIGENSDLSSIASLCEGTQVFTIFQIEDQDSLFDAMSFDSNDRLIEYRQISIGELSPIEDALICSQDVLFIDEISEVIDEKVISNFKVNPFLVIGEEKIIEFIDQLCLPEETKSVLKAMAQDNCGEYLFIATLDKLSLKEEFLTFVDETLAEHKKGYLSICFKETD